MSWWMIHLLGFGCAFGMVSLLIAADYGFRWLERRWHRRSVALRDLTLNDQRHRTPQKVVQSPVMCRHLMATREVWHAR
ncbi:hypothetical protein GC163_19525 [bacterium]|nr:hypothetical protein [bacterium]